MAIVQNPLIGRTRQKFGNSIFQKWKQHNVIRTKPLQVANPRTRAQMAQRSRLAFVLAIFRAVSGIVKIGYKRQATNMTEYNAFMSYNINNASSVDQNYDVEVHPEDLKIARGSIQPTDFVFAKAGDNCTITWPSTPQELTAGQSLSDTLNVLLLGTNGDDASVGTAKTYIAKAERSDGTATLSNVLAAFPDDDTYIHVFFTSEDGRDSEDSQCVDATSIV